MSIVFVCHAPVFFLDQGGILFFENSFTIPLLRSTVYLAWGQWAEFSKCILVQKRCRVGNRRGS